MNQTLKILVLLRKYSASGICWRVHINTFPRLNIQLSQSSFVDPTGEKHQSDEFWKQVYQKCISMETNEGTSCVL